MTALFGLAGCQVTIAAGDMPLPGITTPGSTPEGTPVLNGMGEWCLRNGAAEPVVVEAIGVASRGPGVSCRTLEIWFDPSGGGPIRAAAESFPPGSVNAEVTATFAADRQPVVPNDGTRTCFRVLMSPAAVTPRPSQGPALDGTRVPLSGTEVTYGVAAGMSSATAWSGYANRQHIRLRGQRTGNPYYIPATDALMGTTLTIRASAPVISVVGFGMENGRSGTLSSISLVNGRRATLIAWNVSVLDGAVGQKLYVFETTVSRGPGTGPTFGQMQVEENERVLDPSLYQVFEMQSGNDLRTRPLNSFGATSGVHLVGVVFERPRTVQAMAPATLRITVVPQGGGAGDYIQTRFWQWSGEQNVTGSLTPDGFRSMGSERLIGPFIQESGRPLYHGGTLWTDFPMQDDGTGPNWAGGHQLYTLSTSQLRQYAP